MEFNEFKKKVCNFYRQNGELGYVVDFAPSWSDFVVEAEFKDGYGVKVVFAYKMKINHLNRQSVQKKVEKLMKELSNDLKGIDKELHLHFKEFCSLSIIEK